MIKTGKTFTYYNLGSGSDFASFYHFVGKFYSLLMVVVVSACFSVWTSKPSRRLLVSLTMLAYKQLSCSTGVPSMDMSYVGKVFYPVYHTVHDTYKWLQGLIDPKFEYHLTTARVASKILLSTADSFVLPLDVAEYGNSLDSSFKALEKDYGAELQKNNVSLVYIEDAIKK